jgi:hypothetical protein
MHSHDAARESATDNPHHDGD